LADHCGGGNIFLIGGGRGGIWFYILSSCKNCSGGGIKNTSFSLSELGPNY
jgi:hypothetical protein